MENKVFESVPNGTRNPAVNRLCIGGSEVIEQ